MVTLFDECIEVLGNNAIIFSIEETERLFNWLEHKFPILVSGHIEWDKVSKKIQIKNMVDILNILENKDNAIFVFWDNAKIPALKSTLECVLNVIDDVTAVGFYTWLFSPNAGYVIEFGHGYTMLGFFDAK